MLFYCALNNRHPPPQLPRVIVFNPLGQVTLFMSSILLSSS